MQKVLFTILIFATLAFSLAGPVELFALEDEDAPNEEPQSTEELATGEPGDGLEGARVRRLTCDLTSFSSKWLTINHSACAARCIAIIKQHYKGGYCDKKGICHCRH